MKYSQDEHINCPHCDAEYRLGRTSRQPTPVVCKKCGRLMYDGRRVLIESPRNGDED